MTKGRHVLMELYPLSLFEIKLTIFSIEFLIYYIFWLKHYLSVFKECEKMSKDNAGKFIKILFIATR